MNSSIYQHYIQQNQNLYDLLLQYIDSEDDNIEDFELFISSFQISKKAEDIYEFLQLLSKIIDNHHRKKYFFQRIEKIFHFLKTLIKEKFADFEIFQIFKDNKRVILLLLKNNIFSFNDSIIDYIENKKNLFPNNPDYFQYFRPEFQAFIHSHPQNEEYSYILPIGEKMSFEAVENYDDSRNDGENHNIICKMIRNDSIEEFISYTTHSEIDLEGQIPHSIFETNLFLLSKKSIKFIEYAAFFGSLKIIQYLHKKDVTLPPTLWLYAVHSNSARMIKFLEEKYFNLIDVNYTEIIDEAIRCHHNEICNYIVNNFPNKYSSFGNVTESISLPISECMESFNYYFFPTTINEEFVTYMIVGGYISLIIKIIDFIPNDYINYHKICSICKKKDKFVGLAQLFLDKDKIDLSDVHVSNEITKIKIPAKTQVIPSHLFEHFTFLTQVTFMNPSKVLYISEFTFNGCISLRTIEIPSSVKTIDKSAFENCTCLANIEIPSSVTSIGANCFKGCSSLITIKIPSSVISIGDGAFNICASLKEITLPSSVTILSPYLFSGCTSLEHVEVSSSLTTIGDGAFNNCSSLAELKLPSTVTSVGREAFDDCSLLEEVSLPSISKINPMLFSYCKKLKRFEISPLVTSIEYSAFHRCTSLKEIKIPSSVISIGYNAFGECSSLEECILSPSITSINNNTFNECISLKSITIPSSVTSIDQSAFRQCESLTEISIPSSVTKIMSYAFCGCKLLKKIDFPSSVKEIGEHIFEGCKNIELTGKLEVIPSTLFSQNNYLESIKIPPSVSKIEDHAFLGCKSLRLIELSSDLEVGEQIFPGIKEISVGGETNSIPKNFLKGNNEIKHFHLLSPITVFGSSCFCGWSSLKRFKLPYSTTTLNDSVFMNCTTLVEITIPKNVNYIGENAFSGCTSLTNVIFCSNLITKISSNCFSNCTSLSQIEIPSSVTIIESFAFYNCKSLTKLEVPSSVTTIERYAFHGCNSLRSVLIPFSVSSIEENAFPTSSFIQRKENYTGDAQIKSFKIIESDMYPLLCVSTTKGIDIFGLKDGQIYRKLYVNEGGNLKTNWSDAIPDQIVNLSSNHTLFTYSFIDNDYKIIDSNVICFTLTSKGEILYAIDNNELILLDPANNIKKRSVEGTIINMVSVDADKALIICKKNHDIVFDLYNYEIDEIKSYLIDFIKEKDSKYLKDDLYIASSLLHPFVIIGLVKMNCLLCLNAKGMLDLEMKLEKELIYNEEIKGIKFVDAKINNDLKYPSFFSFTNHHATLYNIEAKSLSQLNNDFRPHSYPDVNNLVIGHCDIDVSVNVKILPVKSRIDIENGEISCIEDIKFKKNTCFHYLYSNLIDISSTFGCICTYLDKTNKIGIFDLNQPYISNSEFSNLSSSWFYNPCYSSLGDFTKMINNYLQKRDEHFAKLSTFIIPYFYESFDSLTEIAIPSSVTTIGNYAFSEHRSLVHVVIPESVTSIGNYAFNECESLIELIIPSSVTCIKNGAFNYCISLKEISIKQITTIASYLFNGCISIEKFEIPSTVTKIENYAFCNCESLAEVYIPSTVKEIGSSAFGGCISLIKMNIPFSVVSLGDHSFCNCKKLKQIVIPPSVQKVGNYAFARCPSLREIEIDSSETEIGMNAFEGCQYVELSHKMIFIQKEMFKNCTSIVHLILPSSLKIIYSYSFYKCSSLTNIVIPESVTFIDNSAFQGCKQFTKITIPESVTFIGRNAFADCGQLDYIKLPLSLKTIENGLFQNCKSLTKIVLPSSSLESIGCNAFSGCENLEEIEITHSVKRIGSFAFDGCSSLKEVSVSSSVESIGAYAFKNCRFLKSACIMASINVIEEGLFYNCFNLSEFKIPRSVTSIGPRAFFQCSHNLKLNISKKVTQIGEDALKF